MKKSVVIALGGNAFQKKGEVTAEAQKAVAVQAGKIIAKLSEKYKVVVTHGNGPQVGNILIHEEKAGTPDAPAMPLETAGAMSQGQIGYWLTQAIDNAFAAEGKKKTAATVITQSIVDRQDPAFRHPTKPIGQFYTKEQALKLAKQNHWTVVDDAGRGWRRVVPSPIPIDIVEKHEIIGLINSGTVVVAVGGGGIPVYRTKVLKKIKGVDAVIDKDFGSEKLAELIYADIFVSVTAVPNACINFGKPNQSALHRITTKKADEYIKQGQFAAGSMLPKMQAVTKFAKKGGLGIITSIEKLEDALAGKAGTIVTKKLAFK